MLKLKRNSNSLAIDVKNWLIRKDPDSGKDWRQEEKGMTEGERHHWLNAHEFEWTPRVGDGQGGLVCCDSWGRKESDTTERLNWTELNWNHPKAECPESFTCLFHNIINWTLPFSEQAVYFYWHFLGSFPTFRPSDLTESTATFSTVSFHFCELPREESATQLVNTFIKSLWYSWPK